VNLPSLPSSLSPQGWADLFACIQYCAPLGGEATGRAFEALCFLLHEPQLKVRLPSLRPSIPPFFLCHITRLIFDAHHLTPLPPFLPPSLSFSRAACP
jgi:hypothetical protein